MKYISWALALADDRLDRRQDPRCAVIIRYGLRYSLVRVFTLEEQVALTTKGLVTSDVVPVYLRRWEFGANFP